MVITSLPRGLGGNDEEKAQNAGLREGSLSPRSLYPEEVEERSSTGLSSGCERVTEDMESQHWKPRYRHLPGLWYQLDKWLWQIARFWTSLLSFLNGCYVGPSKKPCPSVTVGVDRATEIQGRKKDE